MAFENGDNIEDYIGATMEKFKEDNEIFNTCIKYLNIYMVRSDWPYCYKEYKNHADTIVGGDIEYVVRAFMQFITREKYDSERSTNWDKNLPQGFRKECEYFSNIFESITNLYYDFTNNPLGIDRVIKIDRQGYNNLVRIRRIDGEVLDLNLSNFDLENLSKALLDMIKEG